MHEQSTTDERITRPAATGCAGRGASGSTLSWADDGRAGAWLLDSIPHGVVAHGVSGQLLGANRAAHELFGGAPPPFAVEEPGGATVHGVTVVLDALGRPLRPEEWPTSRAAATGSTVANALVLLAGAEVHRKLRVTAAHRTSSPGARGPCVVTTYVDVTDALAALAALEATRHKELLVTRHGTEGWAVLDRSGTVVEVSEHAAIEQWGPRLVGINMVDIVDPPQRPLAADMLARALAAPGVPITEEVPLAQPDGSSLWYEVTLDNLLDEPVLGGIVANVREITERRRLDSDTRFQARLLEAVGQAVIATDAGNRIIYWNGAAEATYGWSAAEVLGELITDVTVTVAGQEQAGQILRALSAGQPWTGEFVVQRRDGTSFPALVTDTPLLDESGALVGVIGVSTDITERKRAECELQQLALRDALTGLPNRALLADRLDQALHRSGWARGRVAVVFADVDGFKVVNDSMGHSCGDALLVSIAERITAALPEATVARFGGDEFVVVLDAADDARAMDAARRLVEVGCRPFEVAGTSVYVTISAGVAVATADSTVESMIRDADVAMYEAKKAGGGRVRAFDHRDLLAVRERMQVDRELREALRGGQLEVFYQPVLDLRTADVRGAEALVRWRHPERGLLSPADFLAVAEATGTIGELTRTVVRTAACQAATWGRSGAVGPDFWMAVNLSGHDLADPTLAGDVRKMLTVAGQPAGRLVVEVTETALIGDTEAALRGLRALRQMGVHVALDDFGTGYSSLSYLRRFPVDTVKIDRSFVTGIVTNPDDAALVAGIVSLSRALHLETVAEGIEDEEQARRLAAMGCTLGQGHLWSPAVPAADFPLR